MAEKNKKTFKMPHTFVIMMVIILFATLLTWIIPAGQYVRVENADGVKVVDPNQFSFIDRCPVNPLLIPLYIVNSMCKRVDLMCSTARISRLRRCSRSLVLMRWSSQTCSSQTLSA